MSMARRYGARPERPRPGKRIPRHSGQAAGTPGRPTPTVGSRSAGSDATASPGWTSTAAAWRTARSTRWPARRRRRPRPGRGPACPEKKLSLAAKAAFFGTYPQGTQLVGATFDYIAGPTKPIDRRRPPERLRQAGRRCRRPGRRPGDAYRRHRPDRRRGPLPPRRRAEGGVSTKCSVTPRPGIDPFFAPHGDHR